jgi:hypothetical protein
VPTIAVRRVLRGQRGGSIWPHSRFYRPEPLLFLPCRSSIVLTRLLLRKSGSAGNRTRSSGSVARNPDHQTTQAAVRYIKLLMSIEIILFYWRYALPLALLPCRLSEPRHQKDAQATRTAHETTVFVEQPPKAHPSCEPCCHITFRQPYRTKVIFNYI